MPKHPSRYSPNVGTGKQPKRASDGNRAPYLYGERWRRARKAFLAKHPVCVQCEREGKLAAASVVDHIRPHRGDLALFWDINNWQALCKQHHDRKTATEDSAFALSANTYSVVLVAGAPGSGKNEYIKRRAALNDLVVDVDALAAAISAVPINKYNKPKAVLATSLALRDAFYGMLARRDTAVRMATTVWVITTNSSTTGRAAIADKIKAGSIVVLSRPMEACRQYVSKDTAAGGILKKINEWSYPPVVASNELVQKVVVDA